ncbi:Transducin family protein / WD-40 repeat family protein isoform 1 [Hibiscus syriacus]|uniref:Transducin family protein / WD-40 repeat family protein isoform 1 n=1 Tax=Hibiscus syriacus TaxID=106335 RepID=A0A6A2XP40_HIBSY|nr:Transducin family protein / WD-40 repeat family protein isoform 1 [Hibiscus syriacus]
MPGTIQVSVLDFEGLNSSSSSRVSIKVSKGKIEYRTWHKGEFSFPLTTLRDNFIITIQDAEGKEISHTGVETRLVVEKGVWDDIFSFEGGGHVHMRLQFVLSEEERQRIRIMRESALKKKHEELRNSGHGSPNSASVSYSKVSGSQESLLRSELLTNEASQVSVPLNSPKDAKFDIGNRNSSVLKQNSTVKDCFTDSVPPKLEKRNKDSIPSDAEKPNNSKKPGPAGKALSNVKNMISAFEGSLNQDARPSIKPPPKLYPNRKMGADSFLENSSSKGTEDLKESTAACIQTERKFSDLKGRFKVKESESVVKEDKKHSKDFKRASTIEKASFSQRMLDKYSKSNQLWNLSTARQRSSRKSITKEGGEEILQKDPQVAEGNSNGKLNSVAIQSDDHCSIGSSGLWIFPGEAKCSCITTGSKQIMDLMGGFWDEANNHQIKFSACDPKNIGEVNNVDVGTSVVANEDGKTSSEKIRPRVEISTEPKESIGPFGQVVKVVIMAGFATLVFLTGKRTYRLDPLPILQM